MCICKQNNCICETLCKNHNNHRNIHHSKHVKCICTETNMTNTLIYWSQICITVENVRV